MGPIQITPADDFNRALTEPPADSTDRQTLRDQQADRPDGHWRRLRSDEIEALVKNGNKAQSWDTILVADPFHADQITHCEFAGLVRIGKVEDVVLTHHDLHVPAGISHSRIVQCDIGDNAAVHHVRYLSHYLVGDRCILHNIDELHCTDHAKFGNGIIQDGEPESIRIWIDLMNEQGGRSVLPFDGMTPADAYLWAKHRGDDGLMDRLKQMTQSQFDTRRGYFGTLGEQCVIKSCRIIKDVKVGPAGYIKGANKLKNLTINSSFEEPSQVGEGVEMVNGIMGYGCRVFYGCKAVRFVMGDNATLKYGARLIHSYLGDNSTVSCCELLNNLIYPAHEQHHNNSFLIAARVEGQCNIAAGATLGSNHNSRANDGELVAKRGFWPGLCTTIKHASRFASFTLLGQGEYSYELDLPLPFTLASNDPQTHTLALVPGYWWTHNMYALKRNEQKFTKRDKRLRKTQHVEFDALAPDTAEEIIAGLDLLARWTVEAARRAEGRDDPITDAALLATGHAMLQAEPARTSELRVTAPGVENSRRDVVIHNPRRGYHAYRDMLHHYAMTCLLAYLQDHPQATFDSMQQDLGNGHGGNGEAPPRQTQWVNVGGQLMQRPDLDQLRYNIRTGAITTWSQVHDDYDRLWQAYPRHKRRHALATLCYLLGEEALTAEQWAEQLDKEAKTQTHIRDAVAATRAKDFDNPFRDLTYDDADERAAVLGQVDDNPFIQQVRQDTARALQAIDEVRRRG
ncbi:MAG: DUF4954 family protein [Phycisphaerales bacterium JB063]